MNDPQLPEKIPVSMAGITVMQVLPRLVTGGAERGAVDVAAALVKAGGKAFVVSEGGPMVRELERAGAKHISMDVATKNPFRIRANARRLAKLIRKNRVDIIHARSRAPAWSAIRAAGLAGIPFMTTFHAPYKFNSDWKKRYNSVMAKGERVIAISDFIARHVSDNYGVDQRRIVTIPRGIDVDKFARAKVSDERTIKLLREWRAPDDLPIVLLPARLSRVKGHETLIEALALRGKRDLYCVMIGATDADANYREELEALVKKRDLEGLVRIVGICTDMPAAYNASALVVAPTIFPEAFGRTVVEAQAMGKPVIASNAGGHTETIEDGRTGLLFPPGDAEALAQAIDAVMALTFEERRGLAEHAQANARTRFTKDAMCRATLGVYAELAGEIKPSLRA